MKRCFHVKFCQASRAAVTLVPVVVFWHLPVLTQAQEAVRNSLEADAAAQTRQLNLESMPYTVKSGDFRLLMTPSLGVDYNDNINLSKDNQLQDVIFRPRVQFNASYPVTQINLLQLIVGTGYDKYVEHDNYSSWQITSGSQLSFDTYVKDVLINAHDRFDYTQDAAGQAVVSGTGNYGTSRNVAGVSLAWNPKDLNITLGYDHQNTMSLSRSFESEDNATELLNARIGWRFIPTATAGVEATYSSTAYDRSILNDNSSYTAGLFAQWQPGSYFRVSGRAGVLVNEFRPTSQTGFTLVFDANGNPSIVLTHLPIRTSDTISYYADLSMTHDITDAVSYSLSVGHETQNGVQSDAIENTYARVTTIWKIFKLADVNAGLTYQHGQQGIGNVTGNLTESFDYYSADLGVTHQFTKRISLGLNYRITLRASNDPSLEYAQNLVGIQVNYSFQ